MEKNYLFEKADKSSLNMSVVPVPVDLHELSQNDKKILRLLCEAVQEAIPICARQRHEDALTQYAACRKQAQTKKELEALRNYFSVALTTYDLYGVAHKDASKIKMAPEGLGQGLYPQDITKKEAKKLAHTKHSLVIREHKTKKLSVIQNSEYFKEHLERAIKKIQEAKKLLKANSSQKEKHLSTLLETTTKTLLDETNKNQDAQLQAWIQNTSHIDFIMDTAREEGSDNLLGARGTAGAGVFLINKKYARLTKTLTKMMPELDKHAPWKYKAKRMQTPCVRFVDVVSWAGDFTQPPVCVLAQNLPNEQEKKDKFGCISIMYANITELVKDQSFPLITKEFFSENDFVDSSYMVNLMTAVHELGHATSRVNFKESPAVVFENYNVLEEARAETFALWALSYLREKKIVSLAQEKTGYYVMLESLIASLCYPPKSHAGARNLMFHYFLESKAIIEENTKKKSTFRIDVKKMRTSCADLLKKLGDVRSTGDVKGFQKLEKYISLKRKKEFEKRFEKIPRGRIIVCPTITQKGEVVFPQKFYEQQQSLEGWFRTHNV